MHSVLYALVSYNDHTPITLKQLTLAFITILYTHFVHIFMQAQKILKKTEFLIAINLIIHSHWV